MPLADKQMSIDGLVIGPGTSYILRNDFNPYTRTTRADQSDSRPWDHGSWSGAEFVESATIPFQIVTVGSDTADWLDKHHALMNVMKATGAASREKELRWSIGGREYVMFVRTRVVQPNVATLGLGYTFDDCVCVALDPRMFSGTLHSTGDVYLPVASGGLSVPITVPITFATTYAGGSASIGNLGYEESGLLITTTGPVIQPRFILNRADSAQQILRVNYTLAAGDILVIDTELKTAILNGVTDMVTTITGEWPTAPNGTSEFLFRAGELNLTAKTKVENRDVWIG